MPRLLLLLAAWLLSFACARAESVPSAPPGRLTSRGRIMPSGELAGFWSNDAPGLFGSYVTWTVRASPAVTYFVRDHLGVGLEISGSYSRGDLFPSGTGKDRELGLGIVMTWSIPLRERWCLMLRPFVGYARQWYDATRPDSFSDLGPSAAIPPELDYDSNVHLRATSSYVRFAASLPFVYAITDSVGIGVGPDLAYDIRFAESGDAIFFSGANRSAAVKRTRTRLGGSVAIYASF